MSETTEHGPEHLAFEMAVSARFKEASLARLFDWFSRWPDGKYKHEDIQDMWVGWQMARQWADTHPEFMK